MRVTRRGATRCCSAFALIATLALSVAADSTPAGPLGLFPSRALWNLSLNNALIAPPAFAGTRAYFPIEEQRLAAYDLAQGSLQWLIDTKSVSQPAVGGGFVYVADGSAIVAFREDTGAAAWRVPFDESLAVPLVFDNEWLIAATVPGSILAFRASDGGLIWRVETSTRPRTAPALAADRVYAATEDARVLAFRVSDGKEIWSRRLGGPATSLLARPDRIFAGSTDNYLYCIDATDAHVIWRWRTGGDLVGVPAVDARRIYFTSLDNMLRANDLATGNQQWMRPLAVRPSRGPILVGDHVLATGNTPTVYGFLAKDGTPAGDLAGGSGIAAPPHVLAVNGLPAVVVVVSDPVERTIVKSFTRSIDPQVTTNFQLPIQINAPTPPGPPGPPPSQP